MRTVTLSISHALLTRHPDLTVIAFVATNLDIAAATLGKQSDPFIGVAETLANAGVTGQNLSDDIRMKAWRKAIGACGLKPSAFRSSAEQLVKRTLADGGVRTPLPLVTAYCADAAKNMAAMGAYDLLRLPTDRIDLRLASPALDKFTPLGGRGEDMPLSENVAVYAAGATVLCYAYNHRDSRDTSLTASTTDGLFVGEAIDVVHLQPLRAAIADTYARLVACGATVGNPQTCNKDSPVASVKAPKCPADGDA